MTIKSQQTKFALCISILLTPQQSVYASDSWNDIATGLAAAGAALLGIGGIVALGNALTQEENPQALLAQAQKIVNNIDKSHRHMITLVQSFKAQEISHGTLCVQESDAYQIGEMLLQRRTYINDYIYSLEKAHNDLHHLIQRLSQRVSSLEKSIDRQSCESKYALLRMKQQIVDLDNEVTQAITYLESRKAYIYVHQVAQTIYEEIRSVIDTYYQYGIGFALEQEIKKSVMRASAQYNYKYPYMEFTAALEHEYEKLSRAVDAIKYSNTSYFVKSNNLLYALDSIIKSLYVDPAYAYEQRMKEQEKLEREHISAINRQTEVERKKTEALQRDAQARERYAQELAQANRLHAQELAEQHAAHAHRPVPLVPPIHIHVNQ